jgi:citrate synthase
VKRPDWRDGTYCHGRSSIWSRSRGLITTAPYRPGLEGVVAAQTAIISVEGEKGKLAIRGFSVEDLAPHVTFEDMVFLLWHDGMPDAEALNRFSSELAAHRQLERHTLELLRSAAARRLHPMDALRVACPSLMRDVTADPVAAQGKAAARQEALRLVPPSR